VPSVKRGKLDERAEKGIFVGYASESTIRMELKFKLEKMCILMRILTGIGT
jgi:hypothetical protein